MVAAILGLSSAAEAGTTRATPSVGVARNRFRENDGAKLANLVSLDPSFIQNLSRLFKAQNVEDSLVRRERRRFVVANPLLRAGAASGSSLGHGFRRRQWPSSLRLSLVALDTGLKQSR